MNSEKTPLPLNHCEAHVWFVFPKEVQYPQLLDAYLEHLDQEEKKRHGRFYFEKDRHAFLLSKVLVRYVLSRYVSVAPSDWRFDVNPWGRPQIRRGPDIPDIRFNLTHTGDLVACVIALGHEVGIDVENFRKRKSDLKIADRFFSAEEAGTLHSLSAEKRRERFFEYWTLKEAFIKACGKGLVLPLNQISFFFHENRSLCAAFHEQSGDNLDHWQFFLLNPTETHKAAVAIWKKTPARVRIIMRNAIPFLSEESFQCEIIYSS